MDIKLEFCPYMLLDLSIYNSREAHEKPIPRPLNTINTIKYYINTLKEKKRHIKNKKSSVILQFFIFWYTIT